MTVAYFEGKVGCTCLCYCRTHFCVKCIGFIGRLTGRPHLAGKLPSDFRLTGMLNGHRRTSDEGAPNNGHPADPAVPVGW